MEQDSNSKNDTSWFSATGIYPYNPHVIPEHAFSSSDGFSNEAAVASTNGAYDNRPTSSFVSTNRSSGPTSSISSTSRARGSAMSPAMPQWHKKGISCLKTISPILHVRKSEPSGRKKQSLEVLIA